MAYTSGFWDSVQGIVSGIGLTAQTSAAILKAYASPSFENIEAVNAAFRAEGTTTPPEIVAILQKRYADAVSNYPSVYAQSGIKAIGDFIPYLALGFLGYLLLKKVGK